MANLRELLNDNGINQAFLDGLGEEEITCVGCDSLKGDDMGGTWMPDGWTCYKCLE